MSKELKQHAVSGLFALTTLAAATFGSTDQAEAQQRSHVGMPQQFEMEIPVDPTNIGRGTRKVNIDCRLLNSAGEMTSNFAYQVDAGGGTDNNAVDRGSILSALMHMSSVKNQFGGAAHSSGPYDHRYAIPTALAIANGNEWIQQQDPRVFADNSVAPQTAAALSCNSRTGTNPNAANFISDAWVLEADGDITLNTAGWNSRPGVIFSQRNLD